MFMTICPKIQQFRHNFLLKTIKMNASSCVVAVCQMTSTNNKENNLNTVKKLVEEAASKQAKIVFLPEACDYIGNDANETQSLAEPLSGFLVSQYKKLAKTHQIWLSIGGFHNLVSGPNNERKIYNTHLLIDEQGDIRAQYSKIHLFDVTFPEKNIALKESDRVERGCAITAPVNTPAGPLGLSICYDMRFPELSTLLRKQGASLLTFPSAFTYATGLVHWEVLLKARAIENQCYVIAAAQYGKHNGSRVSYGQSLIVDPWGVIAAECPRYEPGKESDESVAVATIDVGMLEKIRREMPVFEHRRNDLYRLELCGGKLDVCDKETFKFDDKTIPGSTVFYRTRNSFAFTNIRCVVPGHVLISSIRRAKRLEDLSPEEVADLFQTAVKVEKVMEKIYNTNSTTICIQDGKDAGQTVPHVHIHILPRKPHDFDRNDDIYDKLAAHDRENNPEAIRNLEERSEEARNLRKYFS